MSKNLLISEKIIDFYNQTSEEDRLSQGLGPLEFERNKSLIQRFLPNSDSIVIDVGGGTGKYSEWLAKMGHKVWLIDPVNKHIKLAKKRAGKLNNNFNASIGEARSIDLSNDFADVVILHGPLYHLQEREDRIAAILEAKRVVKENGIIIGFAINYAASTVVALTQGLIHNEEIFNMCCTELSTGLHNAPESIPGVLAEAYYHKPEELKSEFEELNLGEIKMFAVEGLIWMDKNYFTSRGDKKKFSKLLELTKITEADLNLISFSPHMMIAGRKL